MTKNVCWLWLSSDAEGDERARVNWNPHSSTIISFQTPLMKHHRRAWLRLGVIPIIKVEKRSKPFVFQFLFSARMWSRERKSKAKLPCNQIFFVCHHKRQWKFRLRLNRDQHQQVPAVNSLSLKRKSIFCASVCAQRYAFFELKNEAMTSAALDFIKMLRSPIKLADTFTGT